MPSTPPPPRLPKNPNCDDLIEAVVRWIHVSPFVRECRAKKKVKPVPGAVVGFGWDFRIREYAYAKSRLVSFPCVYAHTSPVISQLAQIRSTKNWLTTSSASAVGIADSRKLEKLAEWICNTWGGVPKANFARTGKL